MLALAAAALEIAEAGRFLDGHRMVPATSGNLSLRLDERTIAITRTGTEKGELTEADVMAADLAEPPPPGSSAEAFLHLQLLRDRPQVRAVLHTHGVTASLLSSLRAAEGEIRFRDLEMLKALGDNRRHDVTVLVPIFDNDQDIPRLAQRVSARLKEMPEAVGYLIAGHGLYAWGKSMPEARRHTIAFDHLFTYELERMRVQR